ncbi:nucleotidyl transferase AbiEii/AbiGii toxin family protein [Chitinophaga ginsengisegetis]|uniref:nucleotidyl transferase AbiEii/AbiGii toxin family protein n=1 Tax=Chitinophaga ginsengisegetis TaxID=393003 RepID=UPI000DB90C02|nr:nucleotidyl transferase AbiEii/AbiGii toxin family protein [Chitinophaga ginsengisegetis]MDR6566936.1 hypothetical protein [Chitinophaga ginsengisegetis]MDR6646666.1 hypothetical protein [Chitinophaga ginsengisegetis]MDR6653016.1 hypothetical protein [Chitinophaga ginsengisegetis]
MIEWLHLTDTQRRTSLNQAAVKSGVIPVAIEKDWWVTLVLKALFTTPNEGHFIFKGGTSLSKGFGLIERFSEDIDIALSPEAFGKKYKDEPTHRYVKGLKKEGCAFTTGTIIKELAVSLQQTGLDLATIEMFAEAIDPLMRDKDPQTIYVRYRSLFEPHPYLKNEVRIEFSVRSLTEPFETVDIQSLLWQHFPNPIYAEQLSKIRATHPMKTLLEKMFLLHEKFQVINQRQISPEDVKLERGSRHLFDLIRMDDKGIADQLLTDPQFYEKLLLHRRYWIRQKGVDYDKLQPATLNFRPPAEILEVYRADYMTMRAEMIYGKSEDFDSLIQKLNNLNDKINRMVLSSTV